MKLRLSKRILKLHIIIAIIFLGSSLSKVNAQNAIQLTKVQSGKKLKPIKTGQRLKYTLAPPSRQSAVAVTGTLSAITPTTLTISGQTINIQDIQKLGRSKSGANVLGWGLATLGNIVWIGALSAASTDDVSCSNCNVHVEDDGGTAGTVVLTGVGLGVTYLGIRTLVRNSQKDLISKYKLETVEVK